MRISGLTFLLAAVCCLSGCGTKDTAPNFVFIITDDISISDLGCYGNTAIRTPNIDRLAEEGVRFNNTYLTASSCSPSRCSIITGRYPHNTGAPELHTTLPAGQPMFPEFLRNRGYYTVLSGKNHMGTEVSIAFDTISKGRGPGKEEDWIELLKNRPAGKPFFFWLASTDAHRRWQFDETAPVYQGSDVRVPEYLFDGQGTREDLAGYYHEISRVDHYLGLILEELEKQGVSQNTYLIFCSDNGRPFPRCKTRLYDSGIKTPFLVWAPGRLKQGICDALVSSIDIGPTVLELAGIEQDKRIQGISFAGLLLEREEKTRDFVFAEHNWHVFQAHERMVRYKNWVYIRNSFPERQNLCKESTPLFPAGVELWEAEERGELQPRQRDIFVFPREPEELYNLDADPNQYHNLATNPANQQILLYLRKVLDSWVDRTGDSVPDDPTPDREDAYENKNPDFRRGQFPGADCNAVAVMDRGPVIEDDINSQ